MAMKRCPVCGEKYSETYKNCPFCEEEAALQQGGEIRRNGAGKGGRRVARKGQQPNLLSPILIVLIVVMAALLTYLLFGDRIAGWLAGDGSGSQTETVTPVEPSTGDGETDDGETADGVMPEDPDLTEDPDTGETGETGAAELDYAAAAALPEGLTLSSTDFTLFSAGETNALTVSGGSGTYQWFSEDEGVASVDADGVVTAVSSGNVEIVVTDGEHKGTCIVRVRAASSSTGSTSTGSGSAESSGLTAGPAVVVNGGNGVRVRSGPGTDYEALATVPNGSSVQIVESAGNGWYKITFAGAGGAATEGYMMGEYLAKS